MEYTSGTKDWWWPTMLSKTTPMAIGAEQIGVVMDTVIISKLLSRLHKWWCNGLTQRRKGLGQLINTLLESSELSLHSCNIFCSALYL
jgi:hypothetical protein